MVPAVASVRSPSAARSSSAYAARQASTAPRIGSPVPSPARDVGLPVTVSFTVETDGRLPDGTTLAAAVEAVDAEGGPDWFGVNCAHPTHVETGLGEGPWHRVLGLRPNASRLSHAELDAAEELDEGDPAELRAATEAVRARLTALRVLGGCCGTDVRHVAALWGLLR